MTFDGVCRPTLSDLKCQKLDGRTVPISRDVFADLDTPVSAYLKVKGQHANFLLESVEGGERMGRYSFIGSRPRRVVTVKNGVVTDGGDLGNEHEADPLAIMRAIVQGYAPVTAPRSRFEGGALGYLSYEAARCFERIPTACNDPLGLPDAALMDVDTLLIFDHVAHAIRIVSHAWLDRPLERAYAEAVARIDALHATLEAPVPPQQAIAVEATPFTSNMTQMDFESMVRQVKHHIVEGDILQAVVSHRLSAPYQGDAFALYRRLRAASPSPFMYYLDFLDHQIVGTSPELLVQVEGQRISTRPIAGTRPRGRSAPEDASLAADLLSDDKERAEHLMLVDLARNDVGRVSVPGTVTVSDFMTVERFSHVMHLVSDVTGQLRPGSTAYDALRSAFPAGTVSGAPKIRAMQIIAGLEPDRRGPYAGAVGFVNTVGDLEMAITIRTGVVQRGRLHVQAGAGIVADSVPEREYVETLNKARAVLQAAGGGT